MTLCLRCWSTLNHMILSCNVLLRFCDLGYRGRIQGAGVRLLGVGAALRVGVTLLLLC